MTQKKFNSTIGTIAFILLVALASGESYGEWPMFRYDAENSGYSASHSALSIRDIEPLNIYESQENFLSPVVADLDNDGKNELVAVSAGGNLYALKNFKEAVFEYNAPGEVKAVPAVGHLSDYSKRDIVFASDKTIYAINSKGILLWKFIAVSKITSSIKIADLDNDYKDEIIVGSEDGTLYVLSSDGSKLSEFKTQGSIESTPAVADINKDGSKDIIFGSRDNRLYVISPSINGYSLKVIGIYLTQGDVISSPSVADIDNDGMTEIIFGSGDGTVYCLGYWEMKTEKKKFMNIGTGYWKTETVIDVIFEKKWSYKTKEDVVSSPAVADINNDGLAEVVCGSNDRYLYVFNGFGDKLYGYTTSDDLESSAAIADFDNDGKKEIVVVSIDGKVYVINSAGSRLWEYKIPARVATSPVIADIDSDGKIEIVVVAQNKRVYVFGGKKTYIDWETPKITTTTINAKYNTDKKTSETTEKLEIRKNDSAAKINVSDSSKKDTKEGEFSLIGNAVKQIGGFNGFIILIVMLGFIVLYASYKGGVSSGKKEKSFDENIIEDILRERMRQKTRIV